MAKKSSNGSKNKLSGFMTGPSPVPMRMSAQDKAREARYRAEDDLRTLQRAQEINKDRARMAMCRTVAKEQVKALQGVTGSGKRR